MKSPAPIRIVLPDINRQTQAAKDLAKARALCKSCGVSFKTWVAQNTTYTFPTALRLARVGAQRNPEDRLTRVRAMNAVANRKLRANKKWGDAEPGLNWFGRAKLAYANMTDEDRNLFDRWVKGRHT